MRDKKGQFGKGNKGKPKGAKNKKSSHPCIDDLTKYKGKNIVYILNASTTSFYKIGRSTKFARRVNDISTGCPFHLKIIHTIEFDEVRNMQRTEKILHKVFKHRNIKLEWFDLTSEAIESIQSLNSYEDAVLLKDRIFGFLPLDIT